MLEERAKTLNDKIEVFDGLLVVISGHGMKNCICTSDYQLIDKVAIHRIFSAQYPMVRDIPRLFMYDVCDGSDEQEPYKEEPSVSEEKDAGNEAGKDVISALEIESGEVGKDFTVDDVKRPYEIWVEGERNPDHKLVELHAANSGFQAKLNNWSGSYLISKFVGKVSSNLPRGKYLCEMVDEIQIELADSGKQQIVPVYHNKTRYVTFEKNKQ